MKNAAFGFIAVLLVFILVLLAIKVSASMDLRITWQSALLLGAIIAFVVTCVRSGFSDTTALGLLLWCAAMFLGPRLV